MVAAPHSTFFSTFMRYIKRFLAFAGPGYLIAVGYMDPGNWVTDLAGGSRYGYTLLSVVFISNFIAILLQYCALKLGIASGKDLAAACRAYYSPQVATGLWVLAELAVIATDLAEVIGSAIGLQLLFGIPIVYGICITAGDVLLLLLFSNRHFRSVQLLVTLLIAAIIACFAIIMYLVSPSWSGIFYGLIPTPAIVHDPHMLYLAIGILGATVMPHNLYLHSSIVISDENSTDEKKQQAITYSTIDLCIALTFAFFVNAAILIVSAAVFFKRGMHDVAEIQDAYYLFTPLLNTNVASFVFALALLISGQNSTLTGTLAGQIILEGFMNFSLPPWQRRFLGRVITIAPALIGVIYFGECCLSQMMIFSQIILSLQLPFAVFPLLQFTSNKKIMGKFSNSSWVKLSAYTFASIIVAVNLLLIYFLLSGSL